MTRFYEESGDTSASPQYDIEQAISQQVSTTAPFIYAYFSILSVPSVSNNLPNLTFFTTMPKEKDAGDRPTPFQLVW
ncbi:hypothetical protein QUF63_10130 [Anaerolineales bacterium HSG25]|nr:hypothetical protein [Anaerolineales bacterium HSG25]